MSHDKELGSRRPTYLGGKGLRLANGEVWNFPRPATVPRGLDGERPHHELARAIHEADNEADRGLAELALAIFLLGLNYDLTPEDHQELLAFEPDSDALHDWRTGLRAIATAHVEYYQGASSTIPASTVSDSGATKPSRFFSRWFSWFRAPSTVRR